MLDGPTVEFEYIRYASQSLPHISTANESFFCYTRRRFCNFFKRDLYRFQNSCEVMGTIDRFVAADGTKAIKFGAIVLISDSNLSTSSKKEIGLIDHALIICLMYKVLSSPRRFADISIGFHRDIVNCAS